MSILAPPGLADTMQYTVCFTSVCMLDMFAAISAKAASAEVVTPFAVMADAIDDFPSLTDFFNWSKLLFSRGRFLEYLKITLYVLIITCSKKEEGYVI